MGMMISKLWDGFFGKKEMRILMVGLNAAGKTTSSLMASLIPVMTGPSAPSGIATASSEYNSTVQAWAAFAPGTYGWLTTAYQLPCWIQYQFPTPVVASRYTIVPWSVDSFPGRSPASWQLQGSNDGGTTWTTLDTQTNYTAWIISTPSTFNFTNSTAYAAYRLYITTPISNAYVAIQNWQLVGTTIPTATVVVAPVSVGAVSPAAPTMAASTSQAFSSTVTGGALGTVAWTSTAGTWASNTWTAPATAQTVTITATSVDDPTKNATTTVTVVAAPTAALATSSNAPLFGGFLTLTPTFTGALGVLGTGGAGTTDVSATLTSGAGVIQGPFFSTGTTLYSLRAYNDAGDTADASQSITPQTVSVSPITPANATVSTGASQLLQAQALGSADPAVDWSVDGILGGNAATGTIGGANQVPNASFDAVDGNTDTGAAAWMVYNNSAIAEPASATQIASGGVDGGAFVRLSWSVNNTTSKGVSSRSDQDGGGVLGGWQANTTYRVSWWARATGTNVGMTMNTQWATQPAATTWKRSPSLLGTWQRWEQVITTDSTVEANGGLYLSIDPGTNGTLDIDKVCVRAIGNLVQNADFSAGISTAWTFDASTIGSGNLTEGLNLGGGWAVPGINTAYVYQTGTLNNQADLCTTFSDPVAVAPGQTYMASAYTGTLRCTGLVQVNFYDGGGVLLGSITNSVDQSENVAEASGGSTLSGYKWIYAAGMAPANAATARLVLTKFDTYTAQADSYLFFCEPKLELVSGMGTYVAPAALTSQTNLALQSQAIGTAPWAIGIANSNPTCTAALNADTAPDGTLTASSVTALDADGPSMVQTVTLTPGTYTVSLWMKGYGATVGKTCSVWAWSAGTGTLLGGGTGALPNQTMTGNWNRVSGTFTVATGGTFLLRFDCDSGAATTGEALSVWGYQCQPGATATGYIPTTSSAVTTTAAIHIITATSASDPTKAATTSLMDQ